MKDGGKSKASGFFREAAFHTWVGAQREVWGRGGKDKVPAERSSRHETEGMGRKTFRQPLTCDHELQGVAGVRQQERGAAQ